MPHEHSTTEAPGPRILILSADIGEGHDLPARVLAEEVAARQHAAQVVVADGLAAMGRFIGALVRDNSQVVLQRAPWLYDIEYWLLSRVPLVGWLASAIGRVFGSRGLLKLIRRHEPDVVVSTYPGVTEVLGQLRVSGRLRVPVVSAITDLAGLRYWAHRGVDLHLVTHRESIEEVERIAGPGRTKWVSGLTSPAFSQPPASDVARRALGLPLEGKLVVVSGGGWAVGDLEGAARAVLRRADTTAVVLAGRDEQLRARLERAFAAEPRVRVLGFTDRMSDLLAAADAIIHSTAGLTILEAHLSGCAPISYGWGVGHIRVNNRAYVRHGLADVASSSAELDRVLERALERRPEPDRALGARPSAAASVLSLVAATPV
jgi:processive 1,2-diacylglycerol beta-glucosyltransferase